MTKTKPPAAPASSEKRGSNITVWVPDELKEQLDRKIAGLMSSNPFSRVTRSSYLAELLRQDLERKPSSAPDKAAQKPEEKGS